MFCCPCGYAANVRTIPDWLGMSHRWAIRLLMSPWETAPRRAMGWPQMGRAWAHHGPGMGEPTPQLAPQGWATDATDAARLPPWRPQDGPRWGDDAQGWARGWADGGRSSWGRLVQCVKPLRTFKCLHQSQIRAHCGRPAGMCPGPGWLGCILFATLLVDFSF